jgi:hypothetical protein
VGDVIDRRRRATSESPFEPQIGFSRAVRVGRHIAVAATAAIWRDGEVLGTVRPATGFIVVGGFLDPHWRVEIEADAILDD